MKFRKKPVVIEAHRYDGTLGNAAALVLWASARASDDYTTIVHMTEGGDLAVQTLEGLMTANAGDWLIRGVKGEFYFCKPDIFEATYDEVPA
jgi:hypothetical protein